MPILLEATQPGEELLSRFESVVLSVNRAIVALALATVFIIVFVNVVGRYGFNHSYAWVEEAARHLMILGAFAGAGLALREGRLVSIDLVPQLLPSGLARALRWGMVLVMFGFMLCLTWLGVEFVRFGWNKETMSTGISRGIPYMAIPFGCILFLIQLGFFARRYVNEEFEYDEDDAEARV